MIKVNAAARLKATEVQAGVPNKIKKDVMSALTSSGAIVDREGDSVFVIHNKSESEVERALAADGWVLNREYKEFEKPGEDYVLSVQSSGSATRLEFIYMG